MYYFCVAGLWRGRAQQTGFIWRGGTCPWCPPTRFCHLWQHVAVQDKMAGHVVAHLLTLVFFHSTSCSPNFMCYKSVTFMIECQPISGYKPVSLCNSAKICMGSASITWDKNAPCFGVFNDTSSLWLVATPQLKLVCTQFGGRFSCGCRCT